MQKKNPVRVVLILTHLKPLIFFDKIMHILFSIPSIYHVFLDKHIYII